MPWDPVGDILDGLGDWFSDVLRNVVAALIQGLTVKRPRFPAAPMRVAALG